MTIRELLGSYEILHDGTVIARHAPAGRHQVVMERQYDPRYPASADVAVRDLGTYAARVDGGAAGGGPWPA